MDGVVTGRLGELVGRGGVCVLSGAGLSTESGIPDYRGPSGVLRARLPMTIAEFRGSPEARQRYWARAHIGWRRIVAARPNAGHRAVAALQQAGVLRGIITQNVDGLHQAAGARDVVELDGALDRVVCLECGARGTHTPPRPTSSPSRPVTTPSISSVCPRARRHAQRVTTPTLSSKGEVGICSDPASTDSSVFVIAAVRSRWLTFRPRMLAPPSRRPRLDRRRRIRRLHPLQARRRRRYRQGAHANVAHSWPVRHRDV